MQLMITRKEKKVNNVAYWKRQGDEYFLSSYDSHIVQSTRRVLATVLTILLQCSLSAVTSLGSASFIRVTYDSGKE